MGVGVRLRTSRSSPVALLAGLGQVTSRFLMRIAVQATGGWARATGVLLDNLVFTL
jgi:hypothetical protein